MDPLVSISDRAVWLAGGVPKKKRKRKSGVSRAGADLALLQQVMANAGREVFAGMFDEPTPEVREAPERARGFRLRVDLMHAEPPIWRRLDLPGDLMLDELHVVLQVAMGWEDGHLHKFGVGWTGVLVPTSSPGSTSAKATKASRKTTFGSTRWCPPRATGSSMTTTSATDGSTCWWWKRFSTTRHRLRSA